MTRLLVPEMFGVVAMAYVFIYGLNMFSDIGLRQVLIRSPRGNERAFIDTVWVAQIVRGGVICLFGFGLSALLHPAGLGHWLPVGSSYAHVELPRVLALLSLTALINGFASTKVIIAGRDLNLGRVSAIDLVTQVVGVAVMIAWAIYSRSIDALVAGTIVSCMLNAAFGHWLLPGPANRFVFDHGAIAEIVDLGKWIFVSSIVGFLINSGDRLMLGGLLSAETLGIYSIAALLAGAVYEVINKIATNIVFPALSEINRTNPAALRDRYYKLRTPIDLLCWFVAGLLFHAGESIVKVLYDVRYHEAGLILEILAISLASIGLGISNQMYLAIGRPKYLTGLNTIRMVSLYTLIPIFFWHSGLTGAVWGIVASILLPMPFTYWLNFRLGLLSVRRELLGIPVLGAGLLAGSGMSAAIVAIRIGAG